MGGSINVAIRFRSGEAICVERWTNNIPWWFRNLKMFEGDEEHVRGYLAMTRNNDYIANPSATGLPQRLRNSEYGIIVWDYMTNTIIDNNGYSDPVRWDTINFCDRHYNEETKDTDFDRSRKAASPDGVILCAELLAFCKAGKIGIQTIRQKGREFDHDNPELSGFLPPEEAIRRCQQLWWDEWGPGNQSRSDRGEFSLAYNDTSPMTYVDVPSLQWAPIKAKLLEIGFPMTKKDGLNATIKIPRARQINEHERLSRELWQSMKQLDEYNAHDGVPFDNLATSTQEQIMDIALEMLKDPEKVRQYRLSEYLRNSVGTVMTIRAAA